MQREAYEGAEAGRVKGGAPVMVDRQSALLGPQCEQRQVQFLERLLRGLDTVTGQVTESYQRAGEPMSIVEAALFFVRIFGGAVSHVAPVRGNETLTLDFDMNTDFHP
jgi:hypothetical protein